MNISLPACNRSSRSRSVAFAGWLLAAALAPAGAFALEIPYDYLVPCTPENAIFGYFSPTKKPVVTVKSGAVVRIEGGGGAGGAGAEERNKWLKENNVPLTVEESPALQEIMQAQKDSPN